MTIEEFMKTSEVLYNPYIEDWKKQNKKILGYYCTYIPQEIIHAADMMGFRFRGTEAEGTSRADTIMSRFNCSFVRATLDLAMQGKYDFIDGLACMNSCDHARRIYDIWLRKLVGQQKGIPADYPLFYLSVPHIITDHGHEWLLEEYGLFKKALEEKYKINITNEKLSNSIKVINEGRKLIKDIQTLRALDKPKINGVDFNKLNIGLASTPKEVANKELSSYLNQLKDKDGISDYRARLLLMGSIVDDPEFIKIIEDVGGVVVSDMLCFGLKNVWDLTNESGDPMEAITKRYYNRVSCPRMMDDHQNRHNFIHEQIKSAKVDGIIATRIEFCDLHGCDNMILENQFEDLDIPILSLDRDYFIGDKGRFKTRFEAFIEQIE